jgi:integrator complex subunit 1
MTAVLHNQSLFKSLILCLKSNFTDEFESSSTSSSSTSSSQVNALYTSGSRKRGLSFDKAVGSEVVSNKSLKSVHGQSPMVGKRAQSYATKPQMHIKVVAATILYVAMEPLDHWPMPLVEVYAEDCFGPRMWVDDPACRPLVQNLSLIHRDDDNICENSTKLEADGSKVAEFYRNEKEKLKNNFYPQQGSMASSLSCTPRTSPAPSIGDISARKRSESMGSESSKGVSYSPASKIKNSLQAKTLATSFMRSKNDGDTSDSGDEEEVAIAASSFSKPSNGDDGSSSSSGEDEEICVMNRRSLDAQREMSSNALQSAADESLSPSEPPPPGIKLTYPLQQQKLNFSRVRQRYFGQNLELSYLAVSEKLRERLDTKSKQNSGLLQCLPYFASIPRVRAIITANLEKWLQSPALSGLARALFSKTVNNMKNVDPPLPADLEALDNILRMRLKANQLNAHVGNVTAVATKIPTLAVTTHIYGHILREILVTMDSHDSTFSDHLSMIHAVHDVLPGQLCANGIASSILDMLIKPPLSLDDLSKPQLVRRIQNLIQSIAKKFGSSFDACAVLNAILSFKVDPDYLWTIRDEENKARIMFQCVTLLVDHTAITQRIEPSGKSVKIINPSESDIATVKEKLVEARKLLIRWCCVDYAPLCPSNSDNNRRGTLTNGSLGKKKHEIVGAGPADYSSILDGNSDRSFPSWVEVIRCMLFVERSESPILRQFLSMGDTTVQDLPGWDNEAKRINFCCDYGADVDDDMMWVILKTATEENKGTPNDIALLVLEHLFECCKINMKPSLLIQDSKLLWKLYDLVEYIPPDKKKDSVISDVSGDGHETLDEEDVPIPRLGYPGMWWRVTGLALIMCGASPDVVGAVALEKFPTLKALIKMITSDRYRFPTVDCDDEAREEQKKFEQGMRDDEAKITEYLFAPTKKAKKKSKHQIDNGTQFSGPRSSMRQREKREQELKQQREKEEAEAHAEANGRKKLLRTAQKSITIWDPNNGPRKPPKESADLIFSIGELFDLPRVFQKNTEPDFLLMTIGSTTRGAIERAYDWLIPIISFLPETISRLPASASCFLLLRAYGTHGEDQSQLQELSAPLLQHVRDSLLGKFGEADAVRAFDLLLTDIASHNPDRRRCARRVLTNAIGKEDLKGMDETFTGSNHAWAINLMHVEHAKSILGDAVKQLAVAASFERGGNLRYLVLALHKIKKFTVANNVLKDWNFASLLIELVSRRPTVFAAALSSYVNLRSLAIRVVVEEFRIYVEKKRPTTASENSMVDISLCYSSHDGRDGEPTEVQMPLALLQSSCVLLSIWSEDEKNDKDSACIDGLVAMLMKSRDSEESNNSETNGVSGVEGLASAKLLKTQKSAIPVESWVMLAKSRSDFIAKRAALAAPTPFLPRLLLCSGLPRASLLTMIDRLGRLGEKAVDVNKTFNQLLVPSASSEWDVGRLGHRREVTRKLLGRISAYSRMYNLVQLDVEGVISFSFVEWLSSMCQSSQKSTKMKVKKPKLAPAPIFASIESARALFDHIPTHTPDSVEILNVTQMVADASDMTDFLGFKSREIVLTPKSLGGAKTIEHFLALTFKENKPDTLDKWLCQNFFDQSVLVKRKWGHEVEDVPKLSNDELSVLLLQCYIQLERKVEGIASTLVKWIPKLSSSHGSPKLWRILLADGQKPAFLWDNLASRCFQTWNHAHTTQCRRWILSEDTKEKLDLVKVVRFLIQASTFSAVHVESFEDLPVAVEDLTWGRSEDTVRSATGIALDCLLSFDYEKRLRSRSDPPECLVLLLLISKLGRNQVQFVSGAIIKRMQNDNKQNKCLLLLSLLRIYTYFPFSMNLGAAVLRSNLMEAVAVSADDWLSWRSPLDDSVLDVLDTALSNVSSQRSVQSLIDTAKKHPLLLLRKLEKMENILEKDATVVDSKVMGEKIGLITGEGLNEPLSANANGRKLKISVKHWGYSYREHVWSTILDVISAAPNEVLFQCGLKMGLLELLGVYLRLVLVQSQLRTNIDRLAKLKERLSEFLGKFKSANLKAFDSWMASSNCGLPSLGATRNVLVGCGFLSQQQAMESVKKAYNNTATNIE